MPGDAYLPREYQPTSARVLTATPHSANMASCLYRVERKLNREVQVTGRKGYIPILTVTAAALLLSACSATETPAPVSTLTPTSLPPTPTPTLVSAEVTSTSTPTPTIPAGSASTPTPEPPDSPCLGLTGQIEVQVLVGPAEVVGLEPLAVGSIPFSVTGDEEPFVVQGGGGISYADILVERWGTYEVTLDLQTTVSGECTAGPDGPTLQLTLNMAGQQMVEVESEGFQGEYPWSGEVALDLSFPLVDGATAQGEGWVLVLDLNGS